MEILSEHLCQGWLEGYLLTGRHGLFSSYEAFIHVVDSMFNQHAKWLKTTPHIAWRRPIASLNYLLSSHVWRQDHNGFSHQDPGFIDHVVNKSAEVIRVYLPPDANTLLSVADHCLRSRNYVNVVVAGKQPALTYLSIDDAITHCTRGLGIWEWASNDEGGEPDVVLGCCGDVPTLETLAAAAILRERLPELRVRVVNVVDLMRLQPESEHPHGSSDVEFDSLFTTDRPIVFAYHGYPWLIHRLTYRRTNHANLHVRGYKEEGTTTTPFDMVMLNDLDRFHLVKDVIDRVPGLAAGPRTSGRRWSTGGSRRGPGPARTARTIPTCGTGPGRSEQRPRRQRRVHEPQARRRSTRTAGWSAEARSTTCRRGSRRSGIASSTEGRGSASRSWSTTASPRPSPSSTPLAPLHNAPALRALEAARSALPAVPHVAVFDTAFHATIPVAAATYAVPRAWRDDWGVRRFGFHGIAVQSVAERLDRLAVSSSATWAAAPRRRPSLDGRSVDTTMGFTPLEGLPMATRSGSVDPGILLYALRERGLDPTRLDEALEHESGLEALGGLDDPLGFAVFTYRVAQAVAAMGVALGGVDVVAFSGGVGENRDDVRQAVTDRLGFLGDVRVEVVPAREELVIARATSQLLAAP